MPEILSVDHLNVALRSDPSRHLVSDVSFKLLSAKTTCIVGESGSGKSLTALTIMDLLSKQLFATGQVCFNGVDLTALNNKEMQKIRGAEIGMIFQEPMTSLNPLHTIDRQISNR